MKKIILFIPIIVLAIIGSITLFNNFTVIPRADAANPVLIEVPSIIDGYNTVALLGYVANLKSTDVEQATTPAEFENADLTYRYQKNYPFPICATQSNIIGMQKMTADQEQRCIDSLQGYISNEDTWITKNQ